MEKLDFFVHLQDIFISTFMLKKILFLTWICIKYDVAKEKVTLKVSHCDEVLTFFSTSYSQIDLFLIQQAYTYISLLSSIMNLNKSLCWINWWNFAKLHSFCFISCLLPNSHNSSCCLCRWKLSFLESLWSGIFK